MTEFEKREAEALDKFQARMNEYGLEADRRALTGRWACGDPNMFILWMETKSHPVRGNKKLIERIRRDGFYVTTFRKTDLRTGYYYMVFRVIDRAIIYKTKEEKR